MILNTELNALKNDWTTTEVLEGNSFQLSLWLYAMKSTNHAQEYHYVDASVVYANDVRLRIHVYI